jgi:hypothetical protein
MRVHGFCTECRKFRVVRASGHAIAMLPVTGVAEGICSDCERKEDEERVERFRQRRGGRS